MEGGGGAEARSVAACACGLASQWGALRLVGLVGVTRWRPLADAAQAHAATPQDLDHLVAKIHDPFGISPDDPSRLGEMHAPALATEQRRPKKVLQLAHLSAQRRRGDVNDFRCSLDPALRRDREEVAEVVIIQLQVHSNFTNDIFVRSEFANGNPRHILMA